MTIITPEMVEKAARAIYEEGTLQGSWDKCENEMVRLVWLGQARAALESVLDDVIEECAKVAETIPHQRSAAHWRAAFAAAVLSLRSHQKE